MKKILCVLLVVAVAITCCGVLLTACNETSTDYSHTIVFYSSQGDSLQSATQVAINNFEAKFPGWKVQHVQVGGYDASRKKSFPTSKVNNNPTWHTAMQTTLRNICKPQRSLI